MLTVMRNVDVMHVLLMCIF